MVQVNTGGFSRIDKRQARKLFNSGESVYICPVNFRPDNMWQPAVPMGAEEYSDDDERTFDQIVNAFEYYNCTCSETGDYAAFYVK